MKHGIAILAGAVAVGLELGALAICYVASPTAFWLMAAAIGLNAFIAALYWHSR